MVDPGALPAGVDATDPGTRAVLDDYFRQYEVRWLDETIPALGGATPRQAADDPTRRADLMRLLDSFDSPMDGMVGMSGRRLRAALGLDIDA